MKMLWWVFYDLYCNNGIVFDEVDSIQLKKAERYQGKNHMLTSGSARIKICT